LNALSSSSRQSVPIPRLKISLTTLFVNLCMHALLVQDITLSGTTPKRSNPRCSADFCRPDQAENLLNSLQIST
jgi:hypothetical protein